MDATGRAPDLLRYGGATERDLVFTTSQPVIYVEGVVGATGSDLVFHEVAPDRTHH